MSGLILDRMQKTYVEELMEKDCEIKEIEENHQNIINRYQKKFTIANVRYTQEREKNKELIEVIDSFIRQDHNKGYPTGTEWRNLITEAKEFLSKYPNN